MVKIVVPKATANIKKPCQNVILAVGIDSIVEVSLIVASKKVVIKAQNTRRIITNPRVFVFILGNFRGKCKYFIEKAKK